MIEWREEYRLGNAALDTLHEEFIVMLAEAVDAKGEDFDRAFGGLVDHTAAHFAYEEEQMEAVSLASRREHCDEHRRILSEMAFFLAKAQSGRRSFARAYLRDQLPHWLRQHTATMDADLAARLA